MEKREMEPGKRYRVRLEDCCIQGELSGVFLSFDESGSDEDGWQPEYASAVFDFGHIRPLFGAWSVELAEGH